MFILMIILRCCAMGLSLQAAYESAKSFLEEFVKSGLAGTYVWVYAGLFIFSVALVFINTGGFP